KYKESKGMQGVFMGIRPATVGLIAAAVVFLAETVLVREGAVELIPCGIFLATVILAGKFKVNPIILTIVMGSLGALICG
ncbi:MAG: chromate transporter, partial [Anaerovoracaceae bacterium]